MPEESVQARWEVRVSGTVQGVGFRPFVYREATSLGLRGFVLNDPAGVLLEVEGPAAAVAELYRRIAEHPPPLARVEGVSHRQLPPERPGAEVAFRIVASRHDGAVSAPVSVDSATCADCVGDVFDPANRRFRYPFTNCTNCGPRYTITVRVPYDRAGTTMAGFVMCDRCRAEYEDPSDRRFHAQPNACPDCGPSLSWLSAAGERLSVGEDALARAGGVIAAGGIVALKGIGGYHLVLDATRADAVEELRKQKGRDDKPFAVMVPDLAWAGRLGVLRQGASTLLTSHRGPVVLVAKGPGASQLAPLVAAGLPELGLMLPYSPLHHLLLADLGRPVVMTSGNLSDDPIAFDDADAVARLGRLVAGLLTHDRPIHVRCDDSVVRALPSRCQVLRRARGYAPEPLLLPMAAGRQILAVGAELKSTVSVVKGSTVVTSQHIGDLEHLASYDSFRQAVRHLAELYDVTPEVVAHDLHPEYLSTKWALEQGLETLGIQHHHAHVASLLAEHGRSTAVLGIAFDGLGLGTDGTLWGGEFLHADLGSFQRVGHLPPVVLPGGSAAIREPWRMAVSWTAAALGPAATEALERLGRGLDGRWRDVLALVAAGHGPTTTSAGRLFDAVAALLGLRDTVTYEGQAAVELEALARRAWHEPPVSLPEPEAERADPAVLDLRPLVGAVLAARAAGEAPAAVAAGFHRSLGVGAARFAAGLAADLGLDTVGLTGGVFQNALLSSVMVEALEGHGLSVLVHVSCPPNDGGISLGQAAVAAAGG